MTNETDTFSSSASASAPDIGARTRSGGSLLAALVALIVAIAALLLFVLPAEFGIDPLGTGRATGLDKIANPDRPELERGLARMKRQAVLTLTDAAPPPAPGVTDVWEYQLAPYESVEFKYTLAKGEPIAFRWEASGPLDYDMHGHPFDGGVALTESYSIAKAAVLQGTYVPAFTGIHGWYWTNRSTDNVTLRLSASGQLAASTIYAGGGATERPITGATRKIEGGVEGHELQQPGE